MFLTFMDRRNRAGGDADFPSLCKTEQRFANSGWRVRPDKRAYSRCPTKTMEFSKTSAFPSKRFRKRIERLPD